MRVGAQVSAAQGVIYPDREATGTVTALREVPVGPKSLPNEDVGKTLALVMLEDGSAAWILTDDLEASR